MGDYIMRINGQAVKDARLGGATIKEIRNATTQVVLWRKPAPNYFYFEDRSGAANSISITKTGDTAEWLALEYSTDKSTWTSWDFSQTLTLPANGKVYLKGNNTYGFGKDNSNYHTFTCTGNYALGGDLFSIMDDSLDTYPTRFGSRAFNGSTTLVDISQLVFGNRKMVGLVFTWMFQNCTSLTSLPNEIGVSYPSGTDLSSANSHFLQMFQTAPISNYPTFPNITAIGKNGMYRVAQGVSATPNTNLTYLDLSNITTLYNSALYQSFGHNTSLEVVKIGISAWADFVDSSASDYNATYQWLGDVHSTGVFCKNATLPVTRGINYIPNNWSIADLNGKLYAPVITNTNNTITIAEAEGGASCQIFYTVDGTTPTPQNGTLYTQPFNVGSGVTVRAIAHYAGTRSDLITDSDYAEVVTPGGSLPNVSYMFNYNAKEFDTTTNTFPKSSGQTFDQDLVLTSAPYSTNIADGYVTLDGSSYMDVGYRTAEDNIFNRYDTAGNNTLTLVYKVNWSGTGGGEAALLGNRGRGTLGGQNDWNYMLRYTLFHVSNGPLLTTGTNLGIYYVRVNSDASCIYKCVTNNAYTETQNISYGSPASRNFTFFGDSDYSSYSSLHFQGDFYWFYLSNEALTDQQIQQVIDYNENLSVEPETDCTDCTNWQACGFESYEDCQCQVNGIDCPDPCVDWENKGYESYEECDCAENGNCGDEPDCTDCNNWEECNYASYEDCDCQVNGNCEEEPEEEFTQPTLLGGITETRELIDGDYYTVYDIDMTFSTNGVSGVTYTVEQITGGSSTHNYAGSGNNSTYNFTKRVSQLGVDRRWHFYLTQVKDGQSYNTTHYAVDLNQTIIEIVD